MRVGSLDWDICECCHWYYDFSGDVDSPDWRKLAELQRTWEKEHGKPVNGCNAEGRNGRWPELDELQQEGNDIICPWFRSKPLDSREPIL
jgi:hypothetical protein